MSVLDNVILGVVQGLTEFLPVSSSGHLILVRDFFGLATSSGLAFDAVLHFATALAVVAYFWRDISHLLSRCVYWALGRGIGVHEKMLIIALVVATVPAVILGLLLEDIMATAFRSSFVVAGALVAGSVVMFLAEKYIPRTPLGKKPVDNFQQGGSLLDWKRALLVGLFQSLALVPGMSRSGMAISGAMLMGISREEAARFAFLLAIPLLLGAGGKKLLDLGASGELVAGAWVIAAGALSAFFVGIVVIHYLLLFLRTHSLMVFVWYRLLLAALVLGAVLV